MLPALLHTTYLQANIIFFIVRTHMLGLRNKKCNLMKVEIFVVCKECNKINTSRKVRNYIAY